MLSAEFGVRSAECAEEAFDLVMERSEAYASLRERTKSFSLRIIRLVQALPKDQVSSVLGKQLLRCGTSVGANYRAACRAKSHADFIHKMTIVEEECDESIFWMELLTEAGVMPSERLQELMGEANELLAITVQSIVTAKKGTS